MAMKYKVDVLEMLKQADFSTYRLRKEKLLNETTIQKLRESKTDITVKSVETICRLLDCQPSDILEYVPDASSTKRPL